MHTVPAAPTFEIMAFGTVSPASKFRMEASGRGVSHGHTVKKPEAAGFVTVVFATTADTSSGSPATPDTRSASVAPAARGRASAPTPARVSRIRCGLAMA